jgi:superfamily II DNA or RNA helicase
MLKDCNFLNKYSSGYTEPKEFLTEALIESKTFDLGLGFFSSSAIRSLANGFALFVANGGTMRIIINHILSAQDKKAIQAGLSHEVDFESRILVDVQKLTSTLSREDEHFFNCLSYLISQDRIQFIATVSTKGGLGHDKYGIFTDSMGDKVAFIGSANFSSTALELNGETITTFTSWKDAERVSEYEEMFNETWDNESTPHLIHIPIEKVKAHIEGKFDPKDIKELVQEGANLRDVQDAVQISKQYKSIPLSARLVEKLEAMEAKPRFPYPKERQIQLDAYDAWLKNNKQGIFAMATGSGKTITALNCLLKQYQEKGVYKAIIVVPTQALAIQWEKEANGFNYQNIVSTHTNKEWKSIISRYTTNSILLPNRSIIIITTYATFIRKHMQDFVTRTKGINDFLFIADEAHNLGSTGPLKHLPLNIPMRIGLSATPERIYDDVGSKKLYDFFNSYPPKYTFRFTMKQAIDSHILCKYDYFPIFVDLLPNEMEEYERITDQLRKFIDPDTGKYKPEAEMLLMKRKRIIHKAQNKKIEVSNLLEKLEGNKELAYTFVFVPEGFEPDYAEVDSYDIDNADIHIIDEYAQMFKERGYHYHKYITGLDDAPGILRSFADGDIQVLLSMKCLDEGVDIPRAEHAIFISSTGNPRQFIQRRGRVLRQCKGKEKATIWDFVVTPPNFWGSNTSLEANLFKNEVKRILNFAALAENKNDILYGDLHDICMSLGIDMFDMLETEEEQYK